VSLQEIELNGILNEEKGTLFTLLYPYITCVYTISCSNAYMRLAIYNHMQKDAKFDYGETLISRHEKKDTIQLWINNSVNPPIKFVKGFYYSISWFRIRILPDGGPVTMNGLPAIYLLIVDLSEGQSPVINFAYSDTSIPPETWRYTHGQIPQQLFNLSDLSDLFDLPDPI